MLTIKCVLFQDLMHNCELRGLCIVRILVRIRRNLKIGDLRRGLLTNVWAEFRTANYLRAGKMGR